MTKEDGVKVVEVDPEEDLNTFSRLGLGFGVASKFMKETAEMAKSEISDFKVCYSRKAGRFRFYLFT